MSIPTPAQNAAFNSFLDGLIVWLAALTGALVLGVVTGNPIMMAVVAAGVIAAGIQTLTRFLNAHVVRQP
jgi:predicted PurR-regulated permease PerM